MRWIEYALSSSVMIVIIAALSGIQEIGTLVAIFGVNAAMNLFGWSMESANQGRAEDPVEPLHLRCHRRHRALDRHRHRACGRRRPSRAPRPSPGFVIAIFVSLFIAFNVFAITMILQYGKVGRWRTTSSARRRTCS